MKEIEERRAKLITTKTRIQTIRLMDKIKQNPEIAKEMGIQRKENKTNKNENQ